MNNIRATFESLDDAYKYIVRAVIEEGTCVAPRKMTTRELKAIGFSIGDPRKRYVSIPHRQWSFAYALGELCWHLRGSNNLEEIAFYSNRWRAVSEDGESITSSCYGAKIFGDREGKGSQWTLAKQLLTTDRESRRATIVLADPLDRQSLIARDVSCATSLQFMAREGKLEANVCMRSNDVILGLPYDVFLFTMLQEMMSYELQLEIGTYHHFVGSLHIYEGDVDLATKMVLGHSQIIKPMESMSDVIGLKRLLDCERLTREGTGNGGLECEQDSYWTRLAAVLIYRNGARRGRRWRLEEVVRDPLCYQLAKLSL